MHCSLLCSACGNCPAAEIAWSNSFIDAYIIINWFNVTELAGDARRLLYSAIASWFCACWLALTRDRRTSGATRNCAPQLGHCVNRILPEIGKTGRKKSVNHCRTLRACMSTSCAHRGQVVWTGGDELSLETIDREPNRRMNPRRRGGRRCTNERVIDD